MHEEAVGRIPTLEVVKICYINSDVHGGEVEKLSSSGIKVIAAQQNMPYILFAYTYRYTTIIVILHA